MSHLHVRPARYDWGYDWSDDCPPPQRSRVIVTPPPAPRARASVDLPPCRPHGGVNTDWSGNKCSQLSERSSLAMMPAPVAPLQPPTLKDPAMADQTVQPDDQADSSSMTSTLIFDVAIGLALVLAFVVARRAVLNMTDSPVPQFERKDRF
jgi:hypothetical protein